jgi:hypothetical protein
MGKTPKKLAMGHPVSGNIWRMGQISPLYGFMAPDTISL